MKKPNIIFIFTDQQHWHAAGYMDPFYTTPVLDALAADGTVFTRAYCSTPQCSPSRSTMMTGSYPHKTGVMGNIGASGGADLQMKTIGAMLQEQGYYTGYFGKWHIGKDPAGTAGWDKDHGVTGEDIYNDSMHPHMPLDFLYHMADIDKPFALVVAINDPHDIYHFSKGERAGEEAELPDSYYQQDFSSVPKVQSDFMKDGQGRAIVDKEEMAWKEYRSLYKDKMRKCDAIAGAVLHKVKENGWYDDSLIIYSSDHGDMDTHNRLIFKGPFMYEHMLRVPLIIKAPGQKTGNRTEEMSMNTDLVPTIMDYVCGTVPESDGLSLKPVCEGGSTGREEVVAQYYGKQKWVNPIRTIITKKYKYNRYIMHGEELYDIEDDPGEVKNLAGDPDYREFKNELSNGLNVWIKENNDPFYTLVSTDRQGVSLQ